MNIQTYHNFITMVDCGNLHRAAERLHLVQSALTAQVKALEKEYGAKLFQGGRGARQLLPPEAGWLLYRQAHRLLALEGELRQDMAAVAGGLTGTLRISVAPGESAQFVQRFVVPFACRYPDVRVELRESGHEAILEAVRTGVSELGVAAKAVPHGEVFETLLSQEEQWILAATPTHALFACCGTGIQESSAALVAARATTLPVAAKYPLALVRSQASLLLAYARQREIRLQVAALVDTRAAALELTAAGACAALVSVEPGEMLADGLCQRRLRGMGLKPCKTLFKRRGAALSLPMLHFLSLYAAERDAVRSERS